MFREKVIALLDSCFENRSDLFLIDLEILNDYTVRVVIDGDNGVTVEDCVFVSRAVEHNLDRDTYDFSIEVSSAGATSDLVDKRQYRRNIGRTLKLKTKNNGNVEAELAEVKDNVIVVKWKTREPKPVGKGKITVVNEAEINYDEIEKANVVLKF
jgi:ribosome maturation factor RimP